MTERAAPSLICGLGAHVFTRKLSARACRVHAKAALTRRRMTEVLRGLLACAVRTLINVALRHVAPSRVCIIARRYGFYGIRGYECV